ncbi:hypothetical protein [Pseudomonas putida]|uniref:SMI1/KNR4 family protein n=1 Tax=Pseudomonas putida TaxID=303 RepID=A0A1Q9QYS3_PSEPU|nr:hypothetical protein [Pseudomonas putida]OLS60306.1 hypothetical protein PSEMO_47170 [Pseudomonas putida]
MTFTDEIAAAFSPTNPLPPVLRQAMEFLESQGCVRHFTRTQQRYISLYPQPEYASHITFQVPDVSHTAIWTGSEDPAINQRLSIFLRTGGDGSWAGLWLDDDNRQRIVHLGSGSGSTMLGILVNDAEDLLRLLAIGYDELCWPEQFSSTPEEVREQDSDGDTYLPPPMALRNHVEHTLGPGIPQRAAEFISSPESMDADESTDPFWNWLKQVRNE